MVPHHLIQACFQQFRTDYADSRMMTNVTEHRKQGQYVNGFNTMGLIVWSFVFGVIFNKMGEKGKILIEVVTVINEAITATIDMIMGYLPIGVMFMIARNVLEIDEWETIFKLGMFIIVVTTGL
ncbi:excitatory amino acid transporter 3 [Etheostoma spectabile]|uniref:excitatory amino acid transporter 3 n=1 Tax=Etheostoma spectabile TaxID=54343 RepID=UPI0013AEBB8E|nr:excitatory amino acid transporter 3-like [Etheostoma spectabile]